MRVVGIHGKVLRTLFIYSVLPCCCRPCGAFLYMTSFNFHYHP